MDILTICIKERAEWVGSSNPQDTLDVVDGVVKVKTLKLLEYHLSLVMKDS